jgi:hypothetical protein
MSPSPDTRKPSTSLKLSEDWLSILIAFFVILIATLGLLGPNGIQITF